MVRMCKALGSIPHKEKKKEEERRGQRKRREGRKEDREEEQKEGRGETRRKKREIKSFPCFNIEYGKKKTGNLLLRVSQLAPCAQEIININRLVMGEIVYFSVLLMLHIVLLHTRYYMELRI